VQAGRAGTVRHKRQTKMKDIDLNYPQKHPQFCQK